MLWGEDVGLEVVDLSLFLDFVDGINAVDLGPKGYLQSMCHVDRCLAACNGSVHRLIKPRQ
jgi:DNA-binding NarL/FixJ family response regulator